MNNDKHLKHLGELAVALGIGLAVAPAGMAVAAPSVGDSSTSSSSDSSDQTSSDRSSTDRSTDGTSSDRTSSGASGTDSDSSSDRSGSSTTGDSTTDSQSTSGTDSQSTSGTDSQSTSGTDAQSTTGTESTSATSNDDITGSGATTPDTATAPDPTTPDPTTPDSGTTADESEQVGSSSATTAPDTIDESGAAIAPADQPSAGAVTEPSDSSAPSAQGHEREPVGSAIAPNPPTTPVTGSSGTALESPAVAENPAARGPVPHAPAAIPEAVPATATAPAITTIDGTTALTIRVSDTRADASQVGTQALAPSLPTPAVDVASSVVSKVLGALGLRPFLSNDPHVPIESPTFWALAAAWCRRQEKAITADASRALAAAPVTTGEPIESFAVASTAPSGTSSASTAGPIVGVPDRGTGSVLVSINAPGTQVGYTVTGPPSRGTVTVDATGGFTYTPTQVARQVAALDPSADFNSFDSFTVTVASGQSSTPVTVQVPVSAARMQVAQSTTVGSNPSGAVFAGTRTYVA
ncbi:MAG: hypothetical protein EOP24_43255, partial [Hyphomicrobiales bacterium]